MPRDTGEPWEFVDTGGSDAINDVPADLLTLRQWGAWTLSPAGGPYTSMTGGLQVQEYLNDERPPSDTDLDPDTDIQLSCDVAYTVFGSLSERTCPGCAYTFVVEFAVLEGDPSGCSDPNLPEHESRWTMGYHTATERLLYDFGDADLWLPWYGAEQQGDMLAFDWEVTVGVSLEEEDD